MAQVLCPHRPRSCQSRGLTYVINHQARMQLHPTSSNFRRLQGMRLRTEFTTSQPIRASHRFAHARIGRSLITCGHRNANNSDHPTPQRSASRDFCPKQTVSPALACHKGVTRLQGQSAVLTAADAHTDAVPEPFFSPDPQPESMRDLDSTAARR